MEPMHEVLNNETLRRLASSSSREPKWLRLVVSPIAVSALFVVRSAAELTLRVAVRFRDLDITEDRATYN